jgi:hypothetical protein
MSSTNAKSCRPPILPLYDAIMKGDNEHPDEIIRSIINDITNKVCNQFNNQNKTKKIVRFSEDTKEHDGPLLYKQIAETLVYSFFEKKIIRRSQDIKSILDRTYGGINIKTLIKTKNVMDNVLKRIKTISSYDRISSVNLFRDMTGIHGLKLGKIHEPHLKKLIKLFTRIIYANL